MNTIKCRLRHLEQKALQRGYRLDQVLDCIVERGNGWIVVDIDHSSYPRQHKSKLTFRDVWRMIHTRALLPVLDKAAELVWLESVIDLLPLNCECRAHWLNYLKSNSPEFDNYFAWTVEAHNSVSRRIGKDEMTVQYAESLYAA